MAHISAREMWSPVRCFLKMQLSLQPVWKCVLTWSVWPGHKGSHYPLRHLRPKCWTITMLEESWESKPGSYFFQYNFGSCLGPSRKCFYPPRKYVHASQVAQWLRICLSMQETQEMWVWNLSQEDQEEGLAAHSSILAWKIQWTEEPSGLESMGLQRVGHDWVTNTIYINTCLYTL